MIRAQSICIDPALIHPGTVCPAVYDPVCGCDGLTYGNSCEALKSGVTQWAPGECPGNSLCDGLNVGFFTTTTPNPLLRYFSDGTSLQNGQLVSWHWDFGDGTTASEQNTSHTFPAAGMYLVCLTVEAVDANGNLCQKTYCQSINLSQDCPGNCLYDVNIDLNGVAMKASLTPALQDTPFFFYVLWSLDGGTATGTGLEFHQLIAEPGVHTVCATYPTGDFSAETCTVCKAFQVTAQCVDSAQIDMTVACPLAYIPVCGCNGVTYDNACSAYNYGGVTAWRPGACGSVCNDLSLDFEGFNTGGSLTVWTFNDQSYFPGGQVTSWYWDFGNGQSSNEQNPTINFDTAGDYEVCLYASGMFVDGTQCGGNVCQTIHVANQICYDPTVIDPNVVCTALYDPVCGCDGVTYSNDCEAYYHHGITEWTSGACPDLCINPAWIDTLAPCFGLYDPVCGCDDQTYVNECFALTHGVTSWKKGACCAAQDCHAFFTATILPNHTVLFSGLSTEAETWVLDLGNGSVLYGYFDTLAIPYPTPGIYQACLEISNFGGTCTDQYCIILDLSASGVSNPLADIRLSVQPNPASDMATIRIQGATLGHLTMLDVFGKTVLEQSLSGFESNISTANLSPGIYFLNITTDKGTISRKIAVQR